MSNLLLQPNQVHTLSEIVYETDMMFRNVRKWNPGKSVEQIQQISSARMQSFLTSKQQPLKAEGLNLFHAKSGIFNIDLLSGFGFVAHGTGSRTNELVLVTRGTNFAHNKFDLATNANIGYGIGPRGNVFHRGFLKTFKSYQNQLVNFVTHSGANRPTTIHCMGHSLGAVPWPT